MGKLDMYQIDMFSDQDLWEELEQRPARIKVSKKQKKQKKFNYKAHYDDEFGEDSIPYGRAFRGVRR